MGELLLSSVELPPPLPEIDPLAGPASPQVYEPIRGHWVTLVPMSQENAAEVEALDLRRELLPEMGGAFQRRLLAPLAPPVVIVDNRDGVPVGTLEHDLVPGYPGVYNLTIYADPELARPGFAMEAFGLYVDDLFARGAHIVHMEVLELNRRTVRLLLGRFPHCATYRQHAYVAGRQWDVLVFAIDRDLWTDFSAKFRRNLPGGSRPFSALG